MKIDQLLVIAEFGAMVTTNRFVIVGSLRILERAALKVQYAVIGIFVFEYLLVSRRFAHYVPAVLFFRDEGFLVEVTCIDSPEINGDEQCGAAKEQFAFDLPRKIQPDDADSEQDK